MALKQFDLASLAQMQCGKVNEAVKQLMDQLKDDCIDRPAVKEARKLTLVVSVTPLLDDRSLNSVNVECQISSKVPTRHTLPHNMTVDQGGMYYDDLAPADARQHTMFHPDENRDLQPTTQHQEETHP